MVGGGGTWRCPRCSPRTDDDPAATGDERLRVFLSYGHDGNEELVLRLKGFLEARGHEVWIDKDEIKGGDDWRRAIHDGIAASDQVLSVLSMYSVRDPGVCLNEIAIALSVRGGNISTVLVEPEEAVAVPPSVGHVQWLDMSQWRVRRDEPGFEEWLAGKLDELAEVVESEQSRRFAGEIDRLNRVLRPVLPHARTAALLDRFVGRQWLADEVEVWRADPDARALCLLGAPGVGKSAFTARLQHYWGDRVMAAHFCQWDKPEHRDAAVVVRSLAFQVACRLPQYRARLLDLPQLDDLSGYTADDLFHLLLSDPLQVAIDGGQAHLILAVDAVDEARTLDGDNPLLRVLASNAAGLPRWVRVMLTARPDSDVVPAVAHLNPVVVDGARPENLADITAYLQDRLGPYLAVRPDPAGLLARIVDYSGGVFLYARYFCDAVDRGDLDLNTPEAFPRGLGGIYHQDLIRRFGPGGLEPDTVDYQAAAAVLCAPEPVPLPVLAGALGLTPKQLSGTLDRFGSHLVTDGGVARFTHKSMADYLTGRQAGGFWVDPDDGQPLLAAHCRDLLLDGDPSTLPAYPLRWAAHHLRRAGRIDDAAAVQDRIQALLGDPAWVADTISRLGVDLVESMFNEHDPTSMLARMVRSHSHALRQQTGDPPGVLTTLTWAALRIDQTDLAANYRGIARAKHRPDAGPLALPEWTTERTDPRLIRTLTGHTGPVTSVAFGEIDGRTLLASGSNDKTVRLWNPATGQSIHNLTGHTGPVTSVAFGEIDGRTLLASGSNDKTIRVWDPITGQSIHNLTGHTGPVTSVAFGEIDGRTLLASGSNDKTIRVWDPITGETLDQPITSQAPTVYSVAFGTTLDGQLLLAAGHGGSTVDVWALKPSHELPPELLTPGTDGVDLVEFGTTGDGHLVLAIGAFDGSVRVWDPVTGELVSEPFTAWEEPVACLAFGATAEGGLLLACSHFGEWRLYVNEVLTGMALPPFATDTSTTAAAFGTTTGRHLLLAAGCQDGALRVWEVAASGQPVEKPPTLPPGPVSSVAFGATPEGRLVLATGAFDGSVRVWDPATGLPVEKPPTLPPGPVSSVALGATPDGRLLMAFTCWGYVHLQEPFTGHPVANPIGQYGDVLAFGTTPAGQYLLAYGGWHGSVRVWDPVTGLPVGKPLTDHTDDVKSVAFGITAEGRLLLASGSADNTIRLWDPIAAEPLGQPLTGHSGGVRSVAFGITAEGRLLLASGSADNTIRLWDPIAAEPLGQPLTGHSGGVRSVAFGITAEGRLLLASGSADNTIRLWDPIAAEPLGQPLTGHSGGVRSVAFGIATSGRLTMACAAGNGAYVWDLLAAGLTH